MLVKKNSLGLKKVKSLIEEVIMKDGNPLPNEKIALYNNVIFKDQKKILQNQSMIRQHDEKEDIDSQEEGLKGNLKLQSKIVSAQINSLKNITTNQNTI